MVEHPLGGIDSATVHEAQGRTGALPSAIKPVDPSFRICGRAFTVDCPAVDNLWIHRALYAAEAGDVLVVGTRGELEAGYWGEILSEAALARGLGGLVIEGGVRDVDALVRAGFPVFAGNVCIVGTGKDPSLHGRLGAALVLGSTTVETGDLVVGDRDGVVAVRADAVETVAAAARARLAHEQGVIERLRGGESTLDLYDLPR